MIFFPLLSSLCSSRTSLGVNTKLFIGQLDIDVAGYLITKKSKTETNIPGVFACGDSQDSLYRQAITAAGTGCMAAIDAEKFLGIPK